MDNPLFHCAAKPRQNCRITPRNLFEFWRLSSGFGRVSRQRSERDKTIMKQRDNHISKEFRQFRGSRVETGFGQINKLPNTH
jgi:hypothetical protein